MMTDASKTVVWNAVYRPFGEAVSITGPASNNLRFPGQYFLIEDGLAYNWHRHYDATIGRYLQPDPLGFVTDSSLYAYADGNPLRITDPTGEQVLPAVVGLGIVGVIYVQNLQYFSNPFDIPEPEPPPPSPPNACTPANRRHAPITEVRSWTPVVNIPHISIPKPPGPPRIPPRFSRIPVVR